MTAVKNRNFSVNVNRKWQVWWCHLQQNVCFSTTADKRRLKCSSFAQVHTSIREGHTHSNSFNKDVLLQTHQHGNQADHTASFHVAHLHWLAHLSDKCGAALYPPRYTQPCACWRLFRGAQIRSNEDPWRRNNEGHYSIKISNNNVLKEMK